jgi:hypothetical protein
MKNVISRNFVTNQPFTIADIEVVSNIPFPGERSMPDGKWTPLFDRMKAGDSCAVPASISGEAMRHAGVKWAKKRDVEAEFRVRKTPDGQRMWRVK